jgi:hypothetical protein
MSFHSLHSVDEHNHRNTVVLNQSRAAALEKVDKAPFSYVSLIPFGCHKISPQDPRLFHVKVWLVAGAGFFTDA